VFLEVVVDGLSQLLMQGQGLVGFTALDASYTGMMPDRFWAELGAYYTPPAPCERLPDVATEAGADWRSALVLECEDRAEEHSAPVARVRSGPV